MDTVISLGDLLLMVAVFALVSMVTVALTRSEDPAAI